MSFLSQYRFIFLSQYCSSKSLVWRGPKCELSKTTFWGEKIRTHNFLIFNQVGKPTNWPQSVGAKLFIWWYLVASLINTPKKCWTVKIDLSRVFHYNFCNCFWHSRVQTEILPRTKIGLRSTFTFSARFFMTSQKESKGKAASTPTHTCSSFLHKYTYRHTHEHAHTSSQSQKPTHTCTYTITHLHTHTYTHSHTLTHIHTLTHTYTHTHIMTETHRKLMREKNQ